LTALVSTIAALPLIRSAIHLIASGDYVSQTYFWRTAPAGIDLATVLFGNPRQQHMSRVHRVERTGQQYTGTRRRQQQLAIRLGGDAIDVAGQ